MTSLQRQTSEEHVQVQALRWFTRAQSGLMSSAEQAKFSDWYSFAENARHYDELDQFWGSTEFSVAAQRVEQRLGAVENNPILQSNTDQDVSLNENIATKKARYKIASIAASVMLIVALSFNSLNIKLNADYLTATGEQKVLDLADGSQLILNTDSAVKVTLNEGLRRVDLLAGEIYLDVTKDPAGRAFRVYVGDVLVEVLGTRFSVHQSVDEIIVSGHSGHIEVISQAQVSQINRQVNRQVNRQIISMGERIRITKGNFHREEFSPEQDFAWLNKRLVFNDKPAKEVFAELDRYYKGKIILANEELGKTRITGSYSLANPVKTTHAISQIIQLQDQKISPWLIILR